MHAQAWEPREFIFFTKKRSLEVSGCRLVTPRPLPAAVKAKETPLTLWVPGVEGGRGNADGNCSGFCPELLCSAWQCPLCVMMSLWVHQQPLLSYLPPWPWSPQASAALTLLVQGHQELGFSSPSLDSCSNFRTTPCRAPAKQPCPLGSGAHTHWKFCHPPPFGNRASGGLRRGRVQHWQAPYRLTNHPNPPQ